MVTHSVLIETQAETAIGEIRELDRRRATGD